MTAERIRDWLRDVRYPRTRFLVGGRLDTAQTTYLQIEVDRYDNDTGEPTRWKGRKWRLSPHMTKSEVIATALKAVLTALEHEAREQFTYRGERIYSPHYDVDQLVALRRTGVSEDTRSPAGSQQK